jgi:hypothetical protein
MWDYIRGNANSAPVDIEFKHMDELIKAVDDNEYSRLIGAFNNSDVHSPFQDEQFTLALKVARDILTSILNIDYIRQKTKELIRTVVFGRVQMMFLFYLNSYKAGVHLLMVKLDQILRQLLGMTKGHSLGTYKQQMYQKSHMRKLVKDLCL